VYLPALLQHRSTHTLSLFSLSSSPHHRDLHSFPTRRSSDLGSRRRTVRTRRRQRETPGVWRSKRRAARISEPQTPDSERRRASRSEEHTSELQSLTNLVCRLLLEKKKNKI